MSDDEVMARVCYDFASGFPGVRISGSVTLRTLTSARAVADHLNAEYGEGSHWVEPSNQTYAEFIAEQQA